MTSITIRVDENVKRQSEELFEELGLNMSSAVNMFLKQAIRQQAIPFAVAKNVPNMVTLQAIDDAVNYRNMYGPYESVEELVEALDKE